MQRTLLASKIHNCTLTEANVEYIGSISIDAVLMAAAGILANEQVHVVNVNNGERLVTYAIPALAHSGAVELNGAAARLGVSGDRVIIMTYAQFSAAELDGFSPTVVFVDSANQISEVRRAETAKTLCPSG
jgi:aspartate 1-decarboxylase